MLSLMQNNEPCLFRQVEGLRLQVQSRSAMRPMMSEDEKQIRSLIETWLRASAA
jgi:hypothetical protein